MAKVVKRSVLPIYAVAVVWLIFGLFLPFYRPLHYAAAVLVSLVVFLIAKALCPDRTYETPEPAKKAEEAPKQAAPASTGDPELDALIQERDRAVSEMRRLNDAIPDPELSAAMTRMEKAGRSIAAAVEQAPDKARSIDRFARYYLPEVIKLMTTYANMEKNGVKGGNADQILTELRRNAATTAKAFENQLDALYSAEAMDISTDIEVLDGILKSQNLT